jgi:hypothetical protein
VSLSSSFFLLGAPNLSLLHEYSRYDSGSLEHLVALDRCFFSRTVMGGCIFFFLTLWAQLGAQKLHAVLALVVFGYQTFLVVVVVVVRFLEKVEAAIHFYSSISLLSPSLFLTIWLWTNSHVYDTIPLLSKIILGHFFLSHFSLSRKLNLVFHVLPCSLSSPFSGPPVPFRSSFCLAVS